MLALRCLLAVSRNFSTFLNASIIMVVQHEIWCYRVGAKVATELSLSLHYTLYITYYVRRTFPFMNCLNWLNPVFDVFTFYSVSTLSWLCVHHRLTHPLIYAQTTRYTSICALVNRHNHKTVFLLLFIFALSILLLHTFEHLHQDNACIWLRF